MSTPQVSLLLAKSSKLYIRRRLFSFVGGTRLYHCQELGEPFDFLAWLEYALNEAERFDQLMYALRETEEWQYVEREIDIRLVRA